MPVLQTYPQALPSSQQGAAAAPLVAGAVDFSTDAALATASTAAAPKGADSAALAANTASAAPVANAAASWTSATKTEFKL